MSTLFAIPAPGSTGKPRAEAQQAEVVARAQSVLVGQDEFRDMETVAFVVKEPKADFELIPVVLDEIRGDELLIDMKYSGVCHTDILVQQGILPVCEFPAIFGHEGAGYVRAIGKDVKNKDLKVGDAVLLSYNHCGTCKPCTAGVPAYCHSHSKINQSAVRVSDQSTPARTKQGQAVRGHYFGQSSFAKMSVVSEKCIVKCDDPSQMDVLAPIGCGFQTGAGTVLNAMKPSQEDSLVIFGLGGVGLAAVMAASFLGLRQIIAVDIVPSRLALGKELGATHTLNSTEQPDVVRYIKEVTRGGAQYAMDCTGVIKVIEDAVECLGPQGTAALVGSPPVNAKICIDPLMFLADNKKLIGVIDGGSNPSELIPQLMAMKRAGHFPIEKLCRTYPASQLGEAVRDMHSGKTIKPVISWG